MRNRLCRVGGSTWPKYSRESKTSLPPWMRIVGVSFIGLLMSATTYTAKDIGVLEGLEPVRKRPSMYIGGVDAKGLHHLVWEIVDNAVDEYLNGFGDSVTVTLHKNGDAVTVIDNGRGIPVDMHPKH